MAKTAKKRQKKAKTTNIPFLRDLRDWRNDAQTLLFNLLELAHRKGKQLKDNERCGAIFQLLTGTTFSLWRAVFLAEYALNTEKAIRDATTFLEKVVADNIVAYADEKRSKRWTAGFYVSHIQYRLYHLHTVYQGDLQVSELKEFVKKWGPFADPPLPPNRKKFFLATIKCLGTLTKRLDKLTET